MSAPVSEHEALGRLKYVPTGRREPPWKRRDAPALFEGDVAIMELRTRPALAPDQIPEPVLCRRRGAALTWVGRLTWIVVLTAGGALTLLWLSARHGEAPGHSFDLISYEQPASPDLQVAAASAKNDLARAPQSTMPLPRAVDLLSRPTAGNERHPGRDLTTGAASPAAGPDHIDSPRATEMQDATRPSEMRMTPPAAQVPSFREAIPDRNAIAALVARGRKYLVAGDVAAARLVLRPAALAGDSVAALTLGETYDPVVLKRLGVIGLSGDPAQARDWYRKAAELGSADAPQRLEQLASQLRP